MKMPRSAGWCDICQDFYPISEEEFVSQFGDAIEETIRIQAA